MRYELAGARSYTIRLNSEDNPALLPSERSQFVAELSEGSKTLISPSVDHFESFCKPNYLINFQTGSAITIRSRMRDTYRERIYTALYYFFFKGGL